jgi:hypothetical protein
VSDAIYGRVKGAVYDTKNEYWTVPCGQYLNISFGFGGRQYPIHPLDTVDDNFNKVDANGNHVCIGAVSLIFWLILCLMAKYLLDSSNLSLLPLVYSETMT